MINLQTHTRLKHHGSATALLLVSFGVIAAGQVSGPGTVKLPEFYRTPLSEIIADENPGWRAGPEPEYKWRQGQDEVQMKPGKEARLFPEYDYETKDDPSSRSLLQNEYELDRPRTNLFRYDF